MRRLPSLRGLQAFEAVARLGNLAAAADFLGITGSAVSHRIRGLERELGVPLLQRSPRGLSLTAAGSRYRDGVAGAFADLASATETLLAPDLSRPLTVSLTSEIGLQWLMPRFHRFRALHPDIDTALLSTYEIVDLQAGAADIALRYGAGGWTEEEVVPFLKFSVSPICAPAVRAHMEGMAPREALGSQVIMRTGFDDWAQWLEAAGLKDFEPSRTLEFQDYAMAVAAAVAGQGIVLGYSGYVDAEVAAGLLVQPFELSVPTGKGYYLVYRRERLADPRVRAFLDWVLSETESAEPQS